MDGIKKIQENIRKNPKNANSYFVTFAVKPNAHKNVISEDFGGDLRIEVNAPPQKGKANRAIIKLLSKKLQISSSVVQIVQGATATTKIFQLAIENTDIEDLRKKLLA